MAFRFRGCYTAVVTPFDSKKKVDWEQAEGPGRVPEVHRASAGVVPAGTTGESPTLSWDEHYRVIDSYFEAGGSSVETIAGTGSNSTEESLEATRHVADQGIRVALLVDPYYNGPSSLEIRKEYYEPIVRAFPEVQMIPYVIPGRTGTQLLPQDLAILAREYPNLQAVKEATGSAENARLTRKLCGPEFSIMSGDDDKTLSFMQRRPIVCSGAISVISNIAPQGGRGPHRGRSRRKSGGGRPARRRPPAALRDGHGEVRGEHLVRARPGEGKEPATGEDDDEHPGDGRRAVQSAARPRRQRGPEPHARGPPEGLDRNPEILEPIEKAFDVSIDKRLRDAHYWDGLAYEAGYE